MKVHPYDDPDEDERHWSVPEPDITEQDNPVIATFLAVDGEPLIEIRERRTVAFGYQKE